MKAAGPGFEKTSLCDSHDACRSFAPHMLVAYCGIPHVSKDVNSRWVKSFVQGKTRSIFAQIAGMTRSFFKALREKDFALAANLMCQETRLRLEMTPDVLDTTGKNLFEKAEHHRCGARFTGAGGGGCLWAVGSRNDISQLAGSWQRVLETIPDARLLDTRIDPKGILIL